MLRLLVRAGMSAPSADDERPWHFILVTDREMKTKIPDIHPFGNPVMTAQAAIIVCGDETLQKVQGFWVQDCAAATQNILIEAQQLGLGAVWLGIYPIEGRVEGFRRLLKAPGTVIPFSLVALGYPGEHKEPLERFDAARLHYETW
jgi:nitroreductase